MKSFQIQSVPLFPSYAGSNFIVPLSPAEGCYLLDGS